MFSLSFPTLSVTLQSWTEELRQHSFSSSAVMQLRMHTNYIAAKMIEINPDAEKAVFNDLCTVLTTATERCSGNIHQTNMDMV